MQPDDPRPLAADRDSWHTAGEPNRREGTSGDAGFVELLGPDRG
jgi:hypothetical protein